MQDRWYLLSVEELLGQSTTGDLWEKCWNWLDTERQERVVRLKGKNKKAECIGAGLLLQLAVHEAITKRNREVEQEERKAGQSGKTPKLTISKILELLEQSAQKPLPLEYTYGEKGKPYFKNYPYYFSLSHSKEYIFLAISETEIGADIQWMEPLKNIRIAKRFFTEEEKQQLAACSTEQDRQRKFYQLWAGKEAYGKLTGEGIAATLAMEKQQEKSLQTGEICCEEKERKKPLIREAYEIENYQIAVCKWK